MSDESTPKTGSADERRGGRDDGGAHRLLTDGGRRAGSSPTERYTRAGLAIFAVVGAAALVTAYVTLTLIDGAAPLSMALTMDAMGQYPPEEETLWFSTVSAFNRVLQAALVLGVVVGVFAGRDLDTSVSPTTAGALGAGIGAAGTLAVLLGLVLVLAPDGVDPDAAELAKPVVAVTVGTAIAAWGGAYATDEVLGS